MISHKNVSLIKKGGFCPNKFGRFGNNMVIKEFDLVVRVVRLFRIKVIFRSVKIVRSFIKI